VSSCGMQKRQGPPVHFGQIQESHIPVSTLTDDSDEATATTFPTVQNNFKPKHTTAKKHKPTKKSSSVKKHKPTTNKHLLPTKAITTNKHHLPTKAVTTHKQATTHKPSVKHTTLHVPTVKHTTVKKPSIKHTTIKKPSVKHTTIKKPSIKHTTVTVHGTSADHRLQSIATTLKSALKTTTKGNSAPTQASGKGVTFSAAATASASEAVTITGGIPGVISASASLALSGQNTASLVIIGGQQTASGIVGGQPVASAVSAVTSLLGDAGGQHTTSGVVTAGRPIASAVSSLSGGAGGQQTTSGVVTAGRPNASAVSAASSVLSSAAASPTAVNCASAPGSLSHFGCDQIKAACQCLDLPGSGATVTSFLSAVPTVTVYNSVSIIFFYHAAAGTF